MLNNSLLSLNDDVLLAIFAHIHGQDALNVSLTSTRAYTLAGCRIPSQITCSSPQQLQRIHAYFLSSLPDGNIRAAFVEQFIISASTFEDPADEEGDTYYASNFSQARLIGDILLEVRRLRDLSVERYQPCFVHDTRIGDALRYLSSLINLRLFTVGDTSLTLLQSSRSDGLSRLTLSYYISEEFPLKDEKKSLYPLVSVFSIFHHLHTVKLWNFDPDTGLTRDESFSGLSFPSIRYLRLSETSVPALDIVELCPNLSTLVISLDWAAELITSEGPKWPPLQRLMVMQFSDVLPFYERLSTVNQVQISGSLLLNPDSQSTADDPLHRFLAFLRNASPVGLYMCMRGCLETDGQKAFWNDVPRVAPRLRSLELQLHPPLTESDTDDYSWLVSTTLPTSSRTHS